MFICTDELCGREEAEKQEKQQEEEERRKYEKGKKCGLQKEKQETPGGSPHDEINNKRKKQ